MSACRHCDHAQASHEHLRAGTDCTEAGCECEHFAPHLLDHELPHLHAPHLLHHEEPKPIEHPIEL